VPLTAQTKPERLNHQPKGCPCRHVVLPGTLEHPKNQEHHLKAGTTPQKPRTPPKKPGTPQKTRKSAKCKKISKLKVKK